jgi:hypothetical protein
MKRLISAVFVITACGLIANGAQARDWGPGFSATMVMTNPKNPSQQKTAEFHADKGKSRTTSSIPKKRAKKQGMGKVQVSITNPYQGAMWMVFPDVKKYMEQKGEPISDLPPPPMPDDKEHACNSAKEVTCKKLGDETIGGRKVEKWEIVAEGKDGEISSTSWYDLELGIPIRELVPGKMMREMTNIKVGPQDDSLFMVPEGFEKVEPPEQ